MTRFLFNPRRLDAPQWTAKELGFVGQIQAAAQLPLHHSLPDYAPTPLRDVPELAGKLGVAEVGVKDESQRFGLGAFKGLGASYAVFTVLQRRWRALTGSDLDVAAFGDPAVSERLETITLTAATDGNHGRAVAWTARRLGQRAVIFVPADTVAARIDAIAGEGAEVRSIPGTFDDCVDECARTAEREGWQVIADTAYPGYMEIPGAIMTGYSTLFAEVADQTDRPFDVVMLPVGVGGLAAAGVVDAVHRYGAERPRLVCVEPQEAACFFDSIEQGSGEPIAARGNQQSVMVGLSCGRPSLLAWPIVRDGADLFLAIEDSDALAAMRTYHRVGIESGESGASTLAGLTVLCTADELAPARERLGLGRNTRVLVINTEGATDPENYARVIAGGGRA